MRDALNRSWKHTDPWRVEEPVSKRAGQVYVVGKGFTFIVDDRRAEEAVEYLNRLESWARRFSATVSPAAGIDPRNTAYGRSPLKPSHIQDKPATDE